MRAEAVATVIGADSLRNPPAPEATPVGDPDTVEIEPVDHAIPDAAVKSMVWALPASCRLASVSAVTVHPTRVPRLSDTVVVPSEIAADVPPTETVPKLAEAGVEMVSAPAATTTERALSPVDAAAGARARTETRQTPTLAAHEVLETCRTEAGSAPQEGF